MLKGLLIGGFCFNHYPLNCLSRLNLNLNFIDINLFPPLFSLDNMANSVIQQLDDSGNNILFAYSTGALVALRVGLLKSNIIKRIILINSTPRFIEGDNWSGITEDEFNKMLVKLDKMELDQFMEYFISFAAYPRRIERKKYSQYLSKPTKTGLFNILNILKNTDLRYELNQLGDQVILINADYDVLIHRNVINNRQIYVPDSTHLEINEVYLLKILGHFLCV